MIVSTFTEQEILKELVADFTKSVKPFAKKVARKHLAANTAAGLYCRSDNGTGLFLPDEP